MIYRLFIYWRIGLFLITLFGSSIFVKVPNGGLGAIGPNKDFDYLQSLIQWDGGHYLDIAKFGYRNAQDYAFFPFYPLLIKLLSFFLNNPIFWGLLISHISFLIFLVIFHKILSKKYSKSIALNTIISFLFFPTAFFTTVFYSESLFLLIIILTFYALDNKRYAMAALFISLASVTRLVGITLVFSALYNYLSGINFDLKKINIRIIYPLFGISGILFYSFYLFANSGRLLKFLEVQSLWGRSVSDPFTTIFSYIWIFSTTTQKPFMDYLDLLFTISFFVILLLGVKKIPSSMWIFSMLVLLIPASSGTLTSMPRYLLSSIGAFIIIGKFLGEKPYFKVPFWVLSLLLQIFLYIKFINGYWVA